MKKILIIGIDQSGYYQCVIEELINQGHLSEYIDFEKLDYKYKNIKQRIQNFFSKLLFNKNLKDKFKEEKLVSIVKKKGKYDIIIMTRPDIYENPSTLTNIKSQTKKLVAYYQDSIKRFPKKADIIQIFDKVYSFEKQDCEQYQLEFITNFIYEKKISEEEIYDVFSVLTLDKRYYTLEKVAEKLKELDLNYKFILVETDKEIKTDLFEVSKHWIENKVIKNYLQQSKCLLDIQQDNLQDGLTFRVFESLGYQKKLITTNQDIINYDFYNPNNILVIDKNNIEIPKSFFEMAYQPVSLELIDKYYVKNWIKTIIKN